jgi:hypothetical protein
VLAHQPDLERSLSSAVFVAVQSAMLFFSNTLRATPIPVLLVLTVLPALMGTLCPPLRVEPVKLYRTAAFVMAVLPCVVLAATLAFMAPAALVLNYSPPLRHLIAGTYLLGIATVVWSYAAGVVLQTSAATDVSINLSAPSRAMGALLIIALCAAPAWRAQRIVDEAKPWQDFAQAWDAQHAETLAAASRGQPLLALSVLANPARVGTLETEADAWINRSMARFYGASTILPTTEMVDTLAPSLDGTARE